MARNSFEGSTGRAAARGKKGGRPALPPLEKRGKAIRFAVTYDEKRRIVERAKRAGRGVSEYIRAAALDHPVIAPVPPVTHEVKEELARIGTNLNQIARMMNRGEAAPPELVSLLQETLDTVHDIGVGLASGIFSRAKPRAGAPPHQGDEAERLAEPPTQEQTAP